MGLLNLLFCTVLGKVPEVILNSRRRILAHHGSEIEGYLKIISSFQYSDQPRDNFDFCNKLIGDYLIDHLPATIRESQYPQLGRELDILMSKREKLVIAYNDWFFNQSTDF